MVFSGEITDSSAKEVILSLIGLGAKACWAVTSDLKTVEELGTTTEISAMTSFLDKIILIAKNSNS